VGRNRILGQPFTQTFVGGGITRIQFASDQVNVNAPMGTPANLVLDPCATDGSQVIVKDVGGNAAAQNIVISTSPDHLIASPQAPGGTAASVKITTNFGQITFQYSAALQLWLASA
jgi:hypothetical protein